jgi:hypothetical protein
VRVQIFWNNDITKIAFMKKLRADELQGIFATMLFKIIFLPIFYLKA